jgi:oligo-1,6-glucosidase
MLYHFEGVSLGYLPGQFKQMDPHGYSLVSFKEIYSKWDSVFEQKGWGTIYLGNHDQPRMLTRWGNDQPAFRDASSKLLTTFLLSMRATPYYFSGDELGMNNIKFDSIEDYRDIESINMYKKIKNEGGDLQYFLNGQKIGARDNGRTPFQWDSTTNAGFTSGNPWIKINPNYKTVNAEAEDKDPNSILNYFRKMVRIRKDNPVLIYGSYELLDKENPLVYSFSRTLGTKKMLVLLNFSTNTINYPLPFTINDGHYTIIINNSSTEPVISSNSISLSPYQALILEIK